MHIAAPHRRRPRGGFTLVELLTVIVIIGLLVALISSAAIMARATARKAVDRSEVTQLSMALEKYKTEFGEYPPDFAGLSRLLTNPSDPVGLQAADEIRRHLRKRFPRYDYSRVGDPFMQFVDDLVGGPSVPVGYVAYGVDVARLDPAAALVFWLGGLPEDLAAGATTPAGFRQDPQYPFFQGGQRTQPLFEFKPERLVWSEVDPFDTTNYRYLRYYPPSATVPGPAASPVINDYAPYVYFKARRLRLGGAGSRLAYEYGFLDDPASPSTFIPSFYSHGSPTGDRFVNVAVPYLDAHQPATDPALSNYAGLSVLNYVRRWRNLEKYQVLCAGLDGQYGNLTAGTNPWSTMDRYRYRFSRTSGNFTEFDPDNIGDFSEGALEDELQ